MRAYYLSCHTFLVSDYEPFLNIVIFNNLPSSFSLMQLQLIVTIVKVKQFPLSTIVTHVFEKCVFFNRSLPLNHFARRRCHNCVRRTQFIILGVLWFLDNVCIFCAILSDVIPHMRKDNLAPRGFRGSLRESEHPKARIHYLKTTEWLQFILYVHEHHFESP